MIEASVYDRCVRCGLCLPTCPTYLETMAETSGPRGRISLIKAVNEQQLDVLSPGFVHQMFECLDCRACEAVCPSGVEYGRLVEDARAEIARAQAPRRPLRVRLGRWLSLRILFGHLWLMRFAATLLAFAQRSGLQEAMRRAGVLRMFRLENAQRFAPIIEERYFVPRGQRFGVPGIAGTVMLHAGCIMQVAFARVHEATVRVLQRNGWGVLVPSAQGCCGAIAHHAGEPCITCAMARRNIEAFESSGAQFCIVNAAGCGAQLKEYGELLRDDPLWAERAAAFSERVRDVLEFLDAQGLREGLGSLDVTVTYQDACHLVHAQRVAAAPRRLLRQIPGLELREMHESSLCCGSAGVYNLMQPEMAERLGRRKAENASQTGSQVMATANPGCAMQIAAHVRDLGTTMEIKHVVELIDDSYRAYSAAAKRSRPSSAASIDG